LETILTSRPSVVLSLNNASFNAACADLMELVKQDFLPDALVAIRSGGLHVAKAMARGVHPAIPILAITCRRPSTQRKLAFPAIKRLIAKLPRPWLDSLRILEHKLLTLQTAARRPSIYEFDLAEMKTLQDWIASAPPNAKVLIVDDSVDSGNTLSFVSEAVHRLAPSPAMIRSAAITVTTREPRIVPNYTLLQLRLCRFPWSLDASPELR